jgi:PKD repeat protein
LHNDIKEEYYIAYSQGCYAGIFCSPDYEDYDCIVEKLLNSKGGPVCGIWNTNSGVTWNSGPSGPVGPSQKLHRDFWDKVFGEGIMTIGEAFYESKYNMWWINYFDFLYPNQTPYYRLTYYGSNLFGDPQLVIKPSSGKTQEPLSVNLTGWNSGVTNSKQVFSATVNGGQPPFQYNFNFGNGKDENSTLSIISNSSYLTTNYTYNEAGNYTVCVEVVDNITDGNITNGESASDNHGTWIVEQPFVELTATPNPTIVNRDVRFTATRIGNENDTCYYEFGFGGGSDTICDDDGDGAVYCYHKYNSPGNYNATVNVYDNCTLPRTLLHTSTVQLEVWSFIFDVGGPYYGWENETIYFHGTSVGLSGWVYTRWTFGDGSNPEWGNDVSHIYTNGSTDGTVYNVSCKVDSGGETHYCNTTATIYSGSKIYPIADITASPSCGQLPGQSVTFDASESSDSDGSIIRYDWKFDSGPWEIDKGSSYTRSFSPRSFPMYYEVSVRVHDNQHLTDEVFIVYNVTKIYADFSFPAYTTDVGYVPFYEHASPDPCEEITSWQWNFGDGSTSTAPSPSHHFDDDGYYFIKLKVTDSGGKSHTRYRGIYIRNVKPNASFTTSPLVTAVNENVTFNTTATDVDGYVSGWQWDFGDSQISTSANTTHSYTDSGFYTLNQEVKDDDYDYDAETKNNRILIADAIVDMDYSPSTPGWNVTRFNDIQNATYAVPENGILAILDDTYQVSCEISINKSMDIYAIQKGYNEGDTEIEYGGVEIQGNSKKYGSGENPIFNITAPNVKIKGITFNDSGTRILNSIYYPVNCSCNFTDCTFSNCGFAANCTNAINVTFYNCSFDNNDHGITCENSSHITIFDTDMTSGGEVYSIKLINSDNVTIQDTEISYSNSGLIIENSADNTIQSCSIQHVDDTAILIDNSSGNVISDCSIAYAYKGVEVVDVSFDTGRPLHPSEILNKILDTDFTIVDYGVYLYNSSHTKIGKKLVCLGEMEGLYPIYFLFESQASGPAIPFPATLENATSLFYSNEYPIYISNSHHNLVEGIAVAPLYSSMNVTPPSSQDAISIHDSHDNVVASCFIQNANRSAVNITQSFNNTVCISMLKENRQGITASGGSYNNLVIACSLFNNTDYGVEMKAETSENFVMYNDFVYNNQSVGQAYDAGEGNMWDDDSRSLWRDIVCGNYGLSDDRKIGNFWSDYSSAGLNEGGTGPLPSNRGSTDLLHTGEEPYDISGPAKSQDRGPILQSVWPESWYEGDYPWINPEQPYPLPPVLYVDL